MNQPFDWSEFLALAKVIADTEISSQEARLRTAISRAYYAAFISVRNYLRDQEGQVTTSSVEAHRLVSEQMRMSADPVRQSIADRLRRLRLYRNQADYVDSFPGLVGITPKALELALLNESMNFKVPLPVGEGFRERSISLGNRSDLTPSPFPAREGEPEFIH
jgi:uncharacterized protein (UPF0332 family)